MVPLGWSRRPERKGNQGGEWKDRTIRQQTVDVHWQAAITFILRCAKPERAYLIVQNDAIGNQRSTPGQLDKGGVE